MSMNYLDDFIEGMNKIGFQLTKRKRPIYGSTLLYTKYQWKLPSPKGTVNSDEVWWAMYIKEYDVNPPRMEFYGPLSYQHGKFHQLSTNGGLQRYVHFITSSNYKSYLKSLRKLFKKVNT